MPKGLLLVITQPPAGMEEEFHAWYDTEHLPQRLTAPGFEGVSRWQCIDGTLDWLALYDLASTAALETPAYRAMSGPHSTPWTRRIAPRVGRDRVVAEQVAPGDALLHWPAGATHLLLVRLPGMGQRAPTPIIEAKVPGIVNARLFKSGVDAWFMGVLGEAITAASARAYFASLANVEPTLANVYVPHAAAKR